MRLVDAGVQHRDLGAGLDGHSRATASRGYPQATAGVPRSLAFDADSGDFRFAYQPRRLGAPTEIFVSPLHYPDGPDIDVRGGKLAGPMTDNRIEVVATGSGPVTVTISNK